MKNYLESAFTLIIKLKYYLFSVLLFSSISLFHLLYLFFLKDYDSFYALSVISNYHIYPMIILLVIDYVYFHKFTANQTEEAMDAITQGKPIGLYSLFFARAVIAIIIYAVMISLMFLYSFVKDSTAYFRQSDLLISCLYNLVLPGLVFLIMAFALSRIKRRNIATGILTITAIFCSPIATYFHATHKTNLPIDRIIDLLIYPFSFVYSDFGRFPHPLYGLKIEISRLLLMAGIISLMITTLIIRYSVVRKRVKVAVSLLLSIGLLSLAFLPHSSFHQNLKWNGIYSDLFIYRDANNRLMPWSPAAPVDFKVASYQLDIKRARNLAVKAAMEVVCPKPQTTFDFTLYRGYKIKTLNVAESSDYKWSQSYDKISLTFSQPLKQFHLTIDYAGHSPYFFSTQSACLLPGFFPWYPMAGEKTIFAYYFDDSSNYGYNPLNQANDTALFEVRTSGNDIITHLEPVSEGIYRGYSNGLSILDGLITRVDHNRIAAYCFEDDYFVQSHYTQEQAIHKLDSIIKQAENKYFALSGRRIAEHEQVYLHVSHLGHNFGINNATIFSDHILVDNPYLLLSSVITKDFLIHQRAKTPLMGVFIDYFSEGYPADLSFPEYIDRKMTNISSQLDFTRTILSENPDSEPHLLEQEKVLQQTMLEIDHIIQVIQMLDSSLVEKELYKYSCTPDGLKFRTDQEFLNELKEMVTQ